MRRKLFVSILMFLPFFSFGQNQFGLNSFLGRDQRIILNGDTLSIDSTYTNIESNYPVFDTLIILGQWPDNEVDILCNFKPDSLYTLLYACCGSVDVIPSWKVNQMVRENMQYDESRYQELMMDRPFFTLKVINNIRKDSIYGWYVDHACFPSFKLLTYEDWEYGIPMKCYYWNNVSTFAFFTSTANYSEFTSKGGVVEDVFPYPDYDGREIVEKKATIFVRLFDDDHYVLSFDAQSSEVKLEAVDEL